MTDHSDFDNAPQPILILAERFTEFKHELDKLTRRAARYGNDTIGYTVVGRVVEERQVVRFDGSKRKITTEWVQVELTGEAPRVGPFEFLAKVEHHEGGNLVDVAPGAEGVDRRFRSTAPTCEHCNLIRDRNETFVLRNTETGAQVQVGRQCLKDYMGYDSPTALAWKFRYIREFKDLAESEWGGGRFRDMWLTHDAIALGVAAIRLWGWCPKWQAGDGTLATSHYVSLVLCGRSWTGKGEEQERRLMQQLLDARLPSDDAEADAILKWVRDGGAGDGDYGYNLGIICEKPLFETKRLGMVVSAVAAYNRAMERELRRTKELERAKVSEFVGSEGDRLKGIRCTLRDQRVVGSSQFGDTILIKFEDEAGNRFNWFTGRGTGLQVGTQIDVTGTVKGHKEFQGIKETTLTRCKLEPVL